MVVAVSMRTDFIKHKVENHKTLHLVRSLTILNQLIQNEDDHLTLSAN